MKPRTRLLRDPHVGAVLRRFREFAGKSQVTLAADLGVSRELVRHIELGRRGVDEAVVERWAVACDSTLDAVHMAIAGSPRPMERRITVPASDDIRATILTSASTEPGKAASVAVTYHVDQDQLAAMVVGLMSTMEPAHIATVLGVAPALYGKRLAGIQPADTDQVLRKLIANLGLPTPPSEAP